MDAAVEILNELNSVYWRASVASSSAAQRSDQAFRALVSRIVEEQTSVRVDGAVDEFASELLDLIHGTLVRPARREEPEGRSRA